MTDRFLTSTILLGAVLFGTALVVLPYNTGGGVFMLGAFVVMVGIFLLPRLAPKEDRHLFTKILFIAFLTKIAATGFRLYMNNVVYGGGDLNRFSSNGTIIASQLRDGEFARAFANFGIGTPFTELLVGLVYAVTGTSFYGVFILSGFLGFLGAVLFYRAFRIAFPAGNHRFYAALIFFYPAVLYWPTGFGKDVITFAMLGLTVWGLTLFILQSRLVGLYAVIAGLVVIFLVRPEIGLIATIAFITAFALRKPSANRRAFTIQLVGVPIVLVLGFIFISRATSFLGIESLSLDSVLNLITSQSSQVFDEGRSGSNFVPPQVGTPSWIPLAFITVLFRPFPWEAGSVPGLLQSFDGALLGLIILMTSGRLFHSIKSESRNPMMVFSIVFVLMAVIALGTLGNFGLLARQRVIVLPLIFFMITAVRAEKKRRSRAVEAGEASGRTPTARLTTESVT